MENSETDSMAALQENPEEVSSDLQNKRNYGLDVLRTLAMLFIVLHHLTNSEIWGEITESVYSQALSVNITSAFLDCFFIVGVNVFFLLSGWLKIKLRAGKIFTLLAECYAIGIASVLLAYITGSTQYEGVGQAALQALAFPFSHWFIPAYLLLCLLSPMLNSLAEHLSPKGAAYALAVMVVIFSVVGFVADYFFVNGVQQDGALSKASYVGTNAGYSVVWACVCYFTGRILCMHTPKKLKSAGLPLAMYFAFCLINFAVLCFTVAVLKDGDATKWYIYCYNNPFTYFASVCLLCAFAHIKVNERVGKAFAFLSSHTFAVYIMHSDNPLLSPYRAYIVRLSGGNLLAQVLLLPLNAVVLFIIGVAVSCVYSVTAGRGAKKLGGLLDKKIDNLKINHRE
ncbi:MAG: acyltransferase [Clostridia bacterium]|nr:acyltransferase [Clostridia bacterium]